MFKLITQGLPGEPERRNFMTPVDCEAEYFRLAVFRTDGPGAVKIYSDLPDIVAPAYYRLDSDWDSDWDIPREQQPERMGLWTDTADGYAVPTPFQLRGVARVLDLSGEEISRRLGITGRLWRYYLAEDGERREMPWTMWRVLRLWLEGGQN